MKRFPYDKMLTLWRREYQNRGMPSSYRQQPSGSVIWFVAYLRELGITGGKVIDIGSGLGRNSLFLLENGFEVSAIDIVPENLEALRTMSAKLGIADRLETRSGDLGQRWEFSDNSFDVAIDTFVYKHQVDEDTQENYHKELRRVLKRGGMYLLTLAGKDDGYYGNFLTTSPERDRNLIIDPQNELGSILYSEDEVLQQFGGVFECLYYQFKRNGYSMHNDKYRRSTHLFVFQKK